MSYLGESSALLSTSLPNLVGTSITNAPAVQLVSTHVDAHIYRGSPCSCWAVLSEFTRQAQLLYDLDRRAYEMISLLSTTSVLAAAGLITIYTFVRCWLNFRILPHVPGPFLAKIGPAWLFWHTIRADLYLALPPLFEKYGEPIRIAPDYIVFNDVETAKRIYAVRSPFVKGRWYDAVRLGAERDNVMTLMDEKEHAEKRLKLMPGYSGREVPLEKTLDQFVTQLIEVIRRDYVSRGIPLDFSILASYMTLDMLTKIAFGLEIGDLKANKDHYNYLKSFADFTPIMNLCCNFATIYRIMNSKIMLKFFKPLATDQAGPGALLGVTRKAVIAAFKEPENNSPDTMVASWRRHGLTQGECEDECMLSLVAGSDSTSTALRTTFFHIVSNPRVYLRLNQEIDEALKSGNVSFPVISLSEAKALPYLSAIVKEGLRIFAPLHGLGSHYSLEPFEINGKTIPPRIEIGTDWYGLFRNKKYFGADADEFRPERWIEADADTKKVYDKTIEFMFGYGKSTCLGQNLAMMEMYKTIFEVSQTCPHR